MNRTRVANLPSARPLAKQWSCRAFTASAAAIGRLTRRLARPRPRRVVSCRRCNPLQSTLNRFVPNAGGSRVRRRVAMRSRRGSGHVTRPFLPALAQAEKSRPPSPGRSRKSSSPRRSASESVRDDARSRSSVFSSDQIVNRGITDLQNLAKGRHQSLRFSNGGNEGG